MKISSFYFYDDFCTGKAWVPRDRSSFAGDLFVWLSFAAWIRSGFLYSLGHENKTVAKTS